ncbi:hypothetical protein Cgig2_030426 [Carnegiea gigantea]|uniref:Glutaredoxin domain-containing protein n=1 Tax=Carnegiea gigantea TaxID=171969 RepID=A0A9Q1QP37_9CARY|nr:hypothetical protein Cgig2_030426 [Carnegiea gigantea]
MKGMKGRFLKKLKTVKQIGYLKPDRILQVSALDGFVDNFPLKYTFVDKFPFKSNYNNNNNKNPHSNPNPNPNPNRNPHPNAKLEEPEIIDVAELMRDLEDEENDENLDPENYIGDKENINPSVPKTEESLESISSETTKSSKSKANNSDMITKMPLKELDVSSFRRPDMDSGTLFDPNLLAAFEQAVTEHFKTLESATKAQSTTQKDPYPFFRSEFKPDPLSELDDQTDPLSEFEEKCPPGGTDSVIFYTTSLRGIRKTFEDCQSIRFLLQSFKVIYYERDVSAHCEFRDELWRIMGERVVPPRLFIRGRYIGGAEQVLGLHEQGRLRPLFMYIPIDYSEGPCNGCCGLRFGLCLNCNGSRKVFDHDQQEGGSWSKCTQ